MSEVPPKPDQYRDRQKLEYLQSIASNIFARHGVNFSDARRAGGWSNLTWAAGGLFLRLSLRQGSDLIQREAQLARLLPREVGYPPIVEVGVTDGYEWSLTRELPGRNLGEIWHQLSWDERASALRQLWEKVEAVHSVDVASVASLARSSPWFNAPDRQHASADLHRLVQQHILQPAQAERLLSILDRFWSAAQEAPCVLNHGDLTIENALWREGKVIALLDFEYAVIAPAEVDLIELIKTAYAPPESVDPLPDPGSFGLLKLRQTVANLALPYLTVAGSQERLLGYATLLELWLLQDWLVHPDGEGPLEQWAPYQALHSLARGDGGFLSPLFSQLPSGV